MDSTQSVRAETRAIKHRGVGNWWSCDSPQLDPLVIPCTILIVCDDTFYAHFNNNTPSRRPSPFPCELSTRRSVKPTKHVTHTIYLSTLPITFAQMASRYVAVTFAEKPR